MPSPSISVICPVYNDPDGIQLTLESVTGQTYSAGEYEILAIDNDSDDHTPQVIERYADRYAYIRALSETETQSPAAARNTGIEAARGDILAFIDSDMTAPTDWLESATETLVGGSYDYMGCAIETYTEGEETLGTLHDRLFAFPMAEYLDRSHYVGTGGLVVRREVVDAVGSFDVTLDSSEDKEFGERVHAAGFDQHFDPSITLWHPARASAREHIRKAIRIGRGLRQLANRYPDRFDTGTLDVRSFLPINPLWFRSELGRTGADVTRGEAVGLWALESAAKIARSVGSAAERLRH